MKIWNYDGTHFQDFLSEHEFVRPRENKSRFRHSSDDTFLISLPFTARASERTSGSIEEVNEIRAALLYR